MSGTWGFAVGMPTTVDVDRLIEAFGVPDAGALIPYEDVESALTLSRQQARFRTVTNAWRRRLEREHNLVIEAETNKGFLVLTNRDRVGHSARYFRSGLRRVGVAGRRAASTSRTGLSADEVKALDHVSNVAASFRMQAALEARKLLALPPSAHKPAA